MSERPIWLCADDYGISPAVNGAIRDLMLRGRINATSVMVVAPSFHRSEAVSLDLLNAGVCAGRDRAARHAHRAVPPLSPGFAPVRDGAFLPLQDMLRRAMLRRLSRKKLEVEIATQLEAFVDRVRPRAGFRRRASARASVPAGARRVARRGQGDRAERLGAAVRPRGAAAAAAVVRQEGAAARCAQPRVPQACGRARASPPIRRLPAPMISRRRPCRTSPRCFPAFLDRLPAGGLIMCHPGKVDAELERLDPLTEQREREYAYLAGDAFPALLAAARRRVGRDAGAIRGLAGMREIFVRRHSAAVEPYLHAAATKVFTGRRKPMTPQERQACRRAVRAAALAGERAARSATPIDAINEGLDRRRTRSIRWCRPCWCRTRRSSAPTRASANWRRSSASSSRNPSRRAASSTTCATPCSAARAARARCRRCGRRESECVGQRLGRPTIRARRSSRSSPVSPAIRPAAVWPAAAAVRRQLVPRHRGGDRRRRGRRRAADEQLPRHVRRPAARASRTARSISRAGGAPWGARQRSNSDLAREAGLDDIGRGGRDGGLRRYRRMSAPDCSTAHG